VQQQALRDFRQATVAFFDPENPSGRPSWRKARRDEGFRIVGRGGLLANDAGFERYSGQPRMSAVPVEIEPLR
jgi:hypothetical protein